MFAARLLALLLLLALPSARAQDATVSEEVGSGAASFADASPTPPPPASLTMPTKSAAMLAAERTKAITQGGGKLTLADLSGAGGAGPSAGWCAAGDPV